MNMPLKRVGLMCLVAVVQLQLHPIVEQHHQTVRSRRITVAETQTHIQDLVADMHSNQGTLEKRVNKIEEKLASMQSQLEGLPKVIAQNLIAHQQEQQDQRYLPADCGPTVRRFSPPSRRRRHFPVPLNNSSSQI